MAEAGVVKLGLFEQLKHCRKWGLEDAGKWRENSIAQRGNVIFTSVMICLGLSTCLSFLR